MTSLSALDTFDGYRRLFTDLTLWTPYVEEVLRRHQMEPSGPVWLGVPGTCPTFMVAHRWVVKFFGRLFDGEKSYAAEREAAQRIASDPAISVRGCIPIVPLAGAGELGGEGWPWPYLIFPYVPGERIGDWLEQIPTVGQLRMAAEMGEFIRCLHAVSLEGSNVFPNTHASYLQFLAEQRFGLTARLREWGSLPERMIEAVEGFLPPLVDLIDTTRPPHLIHADLTGDHLLGALEHGRWRTTALIDFGDARTGDLLYELGALHLDLFRGDLRLLAAFLDAYGIRPNHRAALPRRALATALLHQFDLFTGCKETIQASENLEDLAQNLFGAPVIPAEDPPARKA